MSVEMRGSENSWNFIRNPKYLVFCQVSPRERNKIQQIYINRYTLERASEMKLLLNAARISYSTLYATTDKVCGTYYVFTSSSKHL